MADLGQEAEDMGVVVWQFLTSVCEDMGAFMSQVWGGRLRIWLCRIFGAGC